MLSFFFLLSLVWQLITKKFCCIWHFHMYRCITNLLRKISINKQTCVGWLSEIGVQKLNYRNYIAYINLLYMPLYGSGRCSYLNTLCRVQILFKPSSEFTNFRSRVLNFNPFISTFSFHTSAYDSAYMFTKGWTSFQNTHRICHDM